MWEMSSLGRLHALWIFLAHVRSPSTLRNMAKSKGDGFPLFGGEARCSFAEVKDLMAKEPEKLNGVYAPLEDAGNYFSPGYLAFMQKGPNHSARRALIAERVEAARTRLDELEALLRSEPDAEHAIAHFLLLTLGGIKPTPQDVADMVFFRKEGPLLAFLPKWMRTTIFRKKHAEAIEVRHRLMDRLNAGGLQFADTVFDAIWFNSGTLAFYPEKAIAALKADPSLLAIVRAELDAPPRERKNTRALIMEMLRIHSRIASANFADEGKNKFALIVTAAFDPKKYPDPEKIDLTRDHSDSVSFAIPAANRSCPGQNLAPEAMAAVVAHLVRTGAAG